MQPVCNQCFANGWRGEFEGRQVHAISMPSACNQCFANGWRGEFEGRQVHAISMQSVLR